LLPIPALMLNTRHSRFPHHSQWINPNAFLSIVVFIDHRPFIFTLVLYESKGDL
jgi:hypothetical protein